MNRLFAITALSVCSFALANAKSYDIMLSKPTMAGKVELKAGEYRVKINGANAVFTDVNSDKSVTAPVNIVKADRKYGETMIQTTTEGSADRLQEIDLGGSDTKLTF